MICRESVDWDTISDECAILYSVEKTESGSYSAMVRVCGSVEINGERWHFDTNYRVALKKD